MSHKVIDRTSPAAHHPRGERGAATVEFAMVLPLLLAMIIAAVQVGQGWNAKLTVTQAVRQGARIAALGGTPAETRSAVSSAAADLDQSKLTITAPATKCDMGNTASTVTVRASYQYTFEVPLFPRYTVSWASGSSMRCGG